MNFVILSALLLSVTAQIIPEEETENCDQTRYDRYNIYAALKQILTNDNSTLRKLAGIFFGHETDYPRSVKATYNICVVNCMEYRCNAGNRTLRPTMMMTCTEEQCCFTQTYIWSKVPLMENDLYRSLTICPFIIGGVTEREITINMTINETMLPCRWFEAVHLNVFNGNQDGLDAYIQIYSSLTYLLSPMEHALSTMTSDLEVFAVKGENFTWLRYGADNFRGFSHPYFPFELYTVGSTFRYFAGILCYFLFNVLTFMLVYKYRKRIYNNTHVYIKKDIIHNAYIYSFIFSIIVMCFGMIIATSLSGGLCLSVAQLIFMFVMIIFFIAHGFVACCKLTKRPNYFQVFPIFCSCLRWKCLNMTFQVFVFGFLFSLPHGMLYVVLTLILNFFLRPFSFLVVFLYISLLMLILWIGNATFFHLFTSRTNKQLDLFKNKTYRRQLLFAFFILLVIVLLLCILLDFAVVYFFDRRGQAISYLTFIPGIIITITGWYLSGNLVKLFTVLPLPVPSHDEKELQSPLIENININGGDPDHLHLQLEESNNSDYTEYENVETMASPIYEIPILDKIRSLVPKPSSLRETFFLFSNEYDREYDEVYSKNQ
jgi:hypothetical protein